MRMRVLHREFAAPRVGRTTARRNMRMLGEEERIESALLDRLGQFDRLDRIVGRKHHHAECWHRIPPVTGSPRPALTLLRSDARKPPRASARGFSDRAGCRFGNLADTSLEEFMALAEQIGR